MYLLRSKSLRVLALCLLLSAFLTGNALAMKIIITTSLGKTVEMDAQPDETIYDVKSFVFDVIAVQQSSQRMYRGDVELDDSKTLSSYSIAEGDTLHVIRAAGYTGSEPAAGGAKGSGAGAKVFIIIIVLAAVVFVAFKALSGKKTKS